MNVTNYYTLDDFEILPEQSIKKEDKHYIKVPMTSWLNEAMEGIDKIKNPEISRNCTATKIAGYWINKLPPDDVFLILQKWNKTNKPPLDESELKTVVKSNLKYKPKRPKPRIDISHVYDSKRMLDEYQSYIKSLKQNRFITGIHEIDKRIRGVAGGEVLTIIARAGSFKTAMLQNLLKNYIKNSA